MIVERCPECGWGREEGCRFDCPLHMPPADPKDYRRWADLQKEQYVEISRDAATRLAEELRERRWNERHPDVPFGERYGFVDLLKERRAMGYQDEVAAAREDLRLIDEAEHDEERGVRRGDEHRWDLARRTHEVTAGGSVSLVKWAQDVGRSDATLGFYRRVWQEFGSAYTQRPATCLSFTEAWRSVRPGDRTENVQARVTDAYLNRAPPEVKAETAARLLEDPAVMERVTAIANPISRRLAEAIDTQRAVGELEGVLERGHEPGEPSESYRAYEQRVGEAMAADPAMQHDLAMRRLADYQAAYKPADVVEAILASPHTTSVAVYQSGAEMSIKWFQDFLDALREQSKPRLVVSQ